MEGENRLKNLADEEQENTENDQNPTLDSPPKKLPGGN